MRATCKSFGAGNIASALFIACLIFLPIGGCQYLLGVGGFGPYDTIDTVVLSKHVDRSETPSHYIVTTQAGAFEVDNGFLLLPGTADSVFGGLNPGDYVRLRVKGLRYETYIYQAFPYIVEARKLR